MDFLSLINSRHRGSNEYYLELDETQEDYLSLMSSVLSSNIPATGFYSYGGVFTIPSVNPSSLSGMMGRTVNAGGIIWKHGFWIDSSGNLVLQGYTGENLSIPSFVSTYGGQTIKVTLQYEVLDCVCYIDDVEIDRKALTNRPSDIEKPFHIGAYGDNIGSFPESGLYYDGKIHSFFIGSNTWDCNEGSGDFVESNIGGYQVDIHTSNLSPTYIDDFMWQPLNP